MRAEKDRKSGHPLQNNDCKIMNQVYSYSINNADDLENYTEELLL